MPIRTRFWAELRWPEFRDLPENTVAVLPIAATEQHGPHLPVSTDQTINAGILARALTHCPPELPLLVLPHQAVGLSVEHLAFPGTLTLDEEGFLALVTAIGASVARAGVRRLVVMNAHGGNGAMLEVACRRLRVAHRILAVSAHWDRMGRPGELADPLEARYGIHAGRDETALMLRLSPQDVDRAAMADFPSARRRLEEQAPAIASSLGATLAWQAQDLNPAGAVGNAAKATAEMGEALLDFAARRMAGLWRQVAAVDLDAWLRDMPGDMNGGISGAP